RLVDCIAPAQGDVIVEIGPGQGMLTRALLTSGARVYAVEFDRDMVTILRKTFADTDRLTILPLDFLTFQPQDYSLERFKLVGNIPYNITSPVIDWLLRYRERIVMAVLMVQKELAMRIAGQPGSKDWSPLSIFTQLHFVVERCFDVSPKSFRPPPRVDSAVIRLEPRAESAAIPPNFAACVRAAFRHRRKQLVNNLTPDFFSSRAEAVALLHQLGWAEKIRAEQLTIQQFLTLSRHLGTHTSSESDR
ncbi:MAG: ribosomal RNA small subunit methyltransferase A, partial [Candidatus Zixiibacteriota bacterium]